MGVVTNVMVHHSGLEPETNEALIGGPVHRHGAPYEQRLRSLTDVVTDPGEPSPSDLWGGGKCPEVELWGAAFNHVSDEAIFDLVLSVPWEFPEEVQVFICGQRDDKFSVYEIENGQIVKRL